ncbi:MAG: hypothetical protein C5B49_04435 [Bdellovibrio sp.]|nr:MAG: hypothetical protein C5B49_04435 [Bdellovibrio sp.]
MGKPWKPAWHFLIWMVIGLGMMIGLGMTACSKGSNENSAPVCPNWTGTFENKASSKLAFHKNAKGFLSVRWDGQRITADSQPHALSADNTVTVSCGPTAITWVSVDASQRATRRIFTSTLRENPTEIHVTGDSAESFRDVYTRADIAHQIKEVHRFEQCPEDMIGIYETGSDPSQTVEIKRNEKNQFIWILNKSNPLVIDGTLQALRDTSSQAAGTCQNKTITVQVFTNEAEVANYHFGLTATGLELRTENDQGKSTTPLFRQ